MRTEVKSSACSRIKLMLFFVRRNSCIHDSKSITSEKKFLILSSPSNPQLVNSECWIRVPNPKQVSEFQAHKNGKATTAKIQSVLRHCGNKQQSNAGASSIFPSIHPYWVKQSRGLAREKLGQKTWVNSWRMSRWRASFWVTEVVEMAAATHRLIASLMSNSFSSKDSISISIDFHDPSPPTPSAPDPTSTNPKITMPANPSNIISITAESPPPNSDSHCSKTATTKRYHANDATPKLWLISGW